MLDFELLNLELLNRMRKGERFKRLTVAWLFLPDELV